MEIILLERVEKLGQMGDVLKVRDGYARNFLIPHKKALLATKENLKRFEKEKKILEARQLKQKAEAERVAQSLDGKSLVAICPADDKGHLYGSVRRRLIVDLLAQEGTMITREQVRIATPIKTLGTHHVTVQLSPDVATQITLNVARSQAEAQKKTQEDMTEMFEQGEQSAEEVEGDPAENPAENSDLQT